MDNVFMDNDTRTEKRMRVRENETGGLLEFEFWT